MDWSSATEIAAAVARGQSALAVVEARAGTHRRRATRRSTRSPRSIADRARARAQAIDQARAEGKPLGPLAGVPFAVKNLFDVKGIADARRLQDQSRSAAATRDATLIERLEAAGAILVGALNMGEYAYDFTGEKSHDGPSRNPHDVSRMTGGSSGGSGGAVAGGLVPLSLGSDTNGSIRVPSSFCGIFGLKPTYGRLSRARTFPFVASFDHLGPFARNVSDLALAYDAMQGADPDDPVCADRPVEPTRAAARSGHRGSAHRGRRRIFPQGRCSRRRVRRSQRSRRRSVPSARSKSRRRSGRARRPTSSPRPRARRCISTGCAQRASDFDPAVRDRLIAGAMVPATLVVQAQKFRRWYRERVLELFKEVDVILAPATPCAAPAIGQTDLRARRQGNAAAPQHRHLHPADLLHRTAGGRGAGAAQAVADRRAGDRRAMARGCRAARRLCAGAIGSRGGAAAAAMSTSEGAIIAPPGAWPRGHQRSPHARGRIARATGRRDRARRCCCPALRSMRWSWRGAFKCPARRCARRSASLRRAAWSKRGRTAARWWRGRAKRGLPKCSR